MNSLIGSLFLGWMVMSGVAYADRVRSTQLDDLRPLTVYKSPTCGCCGAWVEHTQAADFLVRVRHPENLDAIKEGFGIPTQYQACHTAVKSGYFFEGHIPADVVQRFLKEKPEDVAGLAVPDMPMGSPGMDVPGRYRPYKVLKIHKDGSSTPYARVSIDGIVYSEGDP